MNKIIKRIISIILCLSLSSSCLVSYADVPDYECLQEKDLSKLKKNLYIHKKDKLCDCKTCIMDVMTFDGIFNYVNKLRSTTIPSIDKSIETNKKDEISAETCAYGSFSLVLAGDMVGATMHNTFRSPKSPFSKIYWIGMGLSGVVLGISAYFKNHFYKNTLKEENKINCIQDNLESIKYGIDNGFFEGNNIIISSMDYGIGSHQCETLWTHADEFPEPTSKVIGNLTKTSKKYIDPLISDLNDAKLITSLKKEYDTEMRDWIKGKIPILIQGTVFAECTNLVRIGLAGPAKELLKTTVKELNNEQIEAILKGITKMPEWVKGLASDAVTGTASSAISGLFKNKVAVFFENLQKEKSKEKSDDSL